jgi:sialidase-1
VQHTLDDVPVVEGSVLQLSGAGEALLFSAPSVPNVRQGMAIWRSGDGGGSFVKAVVLSPQRAGYSDLVSVGADTVGVLYETGMKGTYDTIEFRRVGVAELSGG